jgi:hypothetical protein
MVVLRKVRPGPNHDKIKKMAGISAATVLALLVETKLRGGDGHNLPHPSKPI